MLDKPFFENFGKVLYAMAMADGDLQASEVEGFYDRVKQVLHPLDDGSLLSYVALKPFEEKAQAMGQSEAIQFFLDYLRKGAIRLAPAQTDALIESMRLVAGAHGYIEPQEQQFLDLFETKITALMEVLA